MNSEHNSPTGAESDQTLSLGPAGAQAQGESIGTEIGPYRLLRRIGVGGMGEVFEAEQAEPIRRRVALKVIKQGMDTRAVVARFDAERQALAMMDHPCIAKVFDAGATDRGRPYFVMEYVEGEPISDYCNRRRLSTHGRLELFVRVCEGVQHAHQKAVIHRDLKPSNILVADVDGQPLPKIIDFGVAKATTQRLTEMTMFTELGQIIGTPEYMSPEQASLTEDDIDTRADVYALGVVLYELLAGALPFESKDLRQAGHEAIRKIICEQDPPRPSTRLSGLGDRSTGVAEARSSAPKRLQAELSGDLDWITMKALEKDRERRYETANGLAADLHRHLQNEPVSAGPPTLGYRMSKFVRRHRAGVAIATVSVLALATFAVTSNLQATLIARERDRAEAEAAKAAAISEFLATTLASADPWSGGDRDTTVVQALDAAVEQIETAFHDQPEVEASMRAVLGETYLGLGKLEPAAEEIERAVQMRIENGGPDHRTLGELRLVEATLWQRSAKYDSAVESAADAERIFRGDPSAGLGDLLNACQHQARNLLFAQRFTDAESKIGRCEELAAGAEGEQLIFSAENFSLRADLLYERDGDFRAADSLSRQAYERAKAIAPDNGLVPTYLNNAAQYHSQSGDFEGALADFDLALALYEKHFGTDHPEYASCLENRGGVLYRLGRLEETFAALERVRDIRLQNLGPDHIDVVRTGLNMGAVASAGGNFERALSIFRELKPILIEARGPDHPDVLAVLRNEGMALGSLDRIDEALAVLKQALRLSERMNGNDHPHTARARVDYGIQVGRAGRVAEAERLFVAAFDMFLAQVGEEHPSTRNSAQLLVKLYEQRGEPAKADHYRAYVGD